jgi:hypothetical protein
VDPTGQFLPLAILGGALGGMAINYAIELYCGGFDIANVNWGNVALGGIGGAGGGAAGLIAGRLYGPALAAISGRLGPVAGKFIAGLGGAGGGKVGIIYQRTDLTGRLAPYVGKVKSEARYLARQSEHARAHPKSEFTYRIITQKRPGKALDIAEHEAIQKLTGGVAARRSSAVSNLRDPVGPVRRPGFGLREPD